MNKTFIKSLEQNNSDEYKELLSQYAHDISNLTVYKAVAYTTGVDRDGDVAHESFIKELGDKLLGKPVIKNHEWNDVDGTVGRVIKADIIGSDLVVHFYVGNDDTKEKIEQGLFKGVSCGFEPVTEIIDGVTHLTGCKDAFEMSLVTVPAVPRASIILKTFKIKEDKQMFSILKRKQLVSKYPSLKSVEPEVLDELAGGEVELTEADIEELLSENETLKAKVAELESQIAEYKQAEETAKSETMILDEAEKAVNELEPTDEAKEVIMDEAKEAVEKGDLIIEHLPDDETKTCVKGLDQFISRVKTKYTKLGLLGVKKSAVVAEVTAKSFDFTPSKNKMDAVTAPKNMKVKKGWA